MKKIICSVLISFIVLASQYALAESARNSAVSHFVQAQDAYKKGDFNSAVEHYQKIIELGFESGEVHFNLGNAYYRQEKYGKAVLEYERAKGFIARDGDLNFNLRMALKKAGSPPEFERTDILSRAVKEHIDFYTRGEMVFVIVLSLVLAGTVHLLSFVLSFFSSFKRILGVFFITVFAVFSLGLIFKLQYEDNLAIMTDATSAFFEPRENSTIHYELLAGSKVRLIRTEDNWAKIERGDGRLGWVLAEKLETIH